MTVLVSSVVAAVADVKLMPVQTLPDEPNQFTLSVSNAAGDNINQIELIIPQRDGVPSYSIKELGTPAGWTYETRFTVNSPSPFKIIWSTSGAGISLGNSMNFNFVASSPAAFGDNNFEWKATDLKGAESFGKIVVTNLDTALSDFDAKVSGTVSAGKSVDLTVAAMDKSGRVKADYTGTVKFSSSDPLAILPSDYTFQSSESGMKVFRLKLKTAGEQEITVSDGSLQKSIKVNVQQGDVNYIQLSLSNNAVTPDSLVSFSVMSTDVYGNMRDVTKDSKFGIDSEAKGTLSGNLYTAGAVGKWTATATYMASGRQFMDGKLLAVTTEAIAPVAPKQETNESKKKVAMEIVSDDAVEVPFNSTKTFSITVINTGDGNLSSVSLYFTGYSDKSLSISPSSVDISKGKSQRFTVTVSAPELVNTSNVEFLALSDEYSSEKLNASKIIQISVTEPPAEKASSATGNVGMNKNLTYLGIAIIVAVVLIILFWVLFLKDDDSKKKKSEKAEKTE